ncbi:MAG TPA: GFA family protein [Rubellimicrobium sp.]|nr:GFA family protein [Rubellimicrobium sp.]
MALPTLPAEGGCRCGDLRFRVTRAPLFTTACHCRGCQRMTGGAFSLTAAIPDEGFEVIAGEDVPGGADPAFGHRFCPRCLSWVWTKHPMMDGFRNVRSPMFDDPSWTRPYVETWMVEKLPFAESGAVRPFAGFPSMEEYGELLAGYAEWART